MAIGLDTCTILFIHLPKLLSEPHVVLSSPDHCDFLFLSFFLPTTFVKEKDEKEKGGGGNGAEEKEKQRWEVNWKT